MEPLVFVPGLNCTAELYAAQWQRLGVGRAVMVAEHRLDDSLAAIAARLLAAAPPRFALCGLSMGGYIAFEVIRQAPERVTRLALLNTSAKPGTPDSNAMREEMIALVRAGHQEKVMATMWQRLVAPSRLKDEPLKAIVNRMTRETGAQGYVRQQTAIMGRPDSRPGLAGIRVPTLVLVGSDDLITPPAEAEEIAGGIAGARLVVVEGAGHLSTIETPEPVTAALQEWLAA